MKRLFLPLITMMLLSTPAFSAQYVVTGTQLGLIGASGAESQAHLIVSSKPILNGAAHPTCGNRAYILPEDKGLYAIALAARLSGMTANFIYEDAAPAQYVSGHNNAITCKVTSVW